MFKDESDTPVNPDNFGVGTTINPNMEHPYLLISIGPGLVTWVSLRTFTLANGQYYKVMDINWLTRTEFEKVTESFNVTTGELNIYTPGLKAI